MEKRLNIYIKHIKRKSFILPFFCFIYDYESGERGNRKRWQKLNLDLNLLFVFELVHSSSFPPFAPEKFPWFSALCAIEKKLPINLIIYGKPISNKSFFGWMLFDTSVIMFLGTYPKNVSGHYHFYKMFYFIFRSLRQRSTLYLHLMRRVRRMAKIPRSFQKFDKRLSIYSRIYVDWYLNLLSIFIQSKKYKSTFHVFLLYKKKLTINHIDNVLLC